MDLKADVVVVGAGISGLTIAYKYAEELGKKVLVVEKRGHIGGNCYDFINEFGVLVPKYGPHFFHTNNETVWNFVSKFTDWFPYEHRVLSNVGGLLVPLPVNIDTINILLNKRIRTKVQMEKWFSENVPKVDNPANGEEACISRVGKELYEKLFKHYTKKQWDLYPCELDASVLNRIPVRDSFEDRYFTDKYQAMPLNGYTKLFENMIKSKNITVRLDTDYFSVAGRIDASKIFFTGPIDRYFEYTVGEKLQYRSLRFEYENLETEYYQKATQINYPNEELFTRITEPKHATGQVLPNTTIIREYPTWEGEGYYPVINNRNTSLFDKYQSQAVVLEEKGIYFVGRLATYKYINMDEAFAAALSLYDRLKKVD